MNKSNLKTGMIVTIRNGIEFVVFKNIETKDQFADKDVLLNKTSFKKQYLDDYTENLKSKLSEHFDIVKIQVPDDVFSIMDLDFRRNKRITLWEDIQVNKKRKRVK